MEKTAVVIPAYNEGSTIAHVLRGVVSYEPKIIVVNDGSSDNTEQEVRRTGHILLNHRVNLGKGAALRTGCDYAVMHGAQKIIVMDADGQHNPNKIPLFKEQLNKYDLVCSSRQERTDMPFVLRFGNRFINHTLQMLYGIPINDSQCGYRAFTAEAYKKIRWTASDYYMETEMILNARRHKLKMTQIPIETIYSNKYKGTTVLDGVKIVLKALGRMGQ